MKTILLALAACLIMGCHHHNTAQPVTFKNGIVATTHKQAADIGIEILKSGGNAIDAAIATSAAMGLMEPMSCGIGGDLFAIVWDAKSQKLYGIDASGRAPYAATIEYFESKHLREIPLYGPLTWSVPGCVDGWDQLRAKFGTMTFEELLAPSIKAADEGFEVPQTIAGYWATAAQAPRMKDQPDWTATYLKNGQPPKPGETMTNPRLARTYRLIAKGGRDAFYKGDIAKQIVEFSKRAGGLFEMRDFEAHTSNWVQPVSTTYRGHRVFELPPPGQGIAVLQMLNILEGFDFKQYAPNSAERWHLFTEAKRLAYADRAKYYTDPEFAKVPVAELISKDYAANCRQMIKPDQAMTAALPGVNLGGGTIYLTVVDKDRNCVSLIQSNYHGFGSGMVPGELGFALQNRGNLFALDRNHANKLEPHKRPFHTIIPAMVMKNDKPFFCFGVMGGDMQPQGHVQVLTNLIDYNMNIQAAGDHPRIEHTYSATPTGRPEMGVGVIEAEPGVPDQTVLALINKGHAVKRIKKNGGGYQGILIDWDKGELLGASESRRDGKAGGY